MKKMKKALLLVTSAGALMAASVWGTMAYLTDHDSVVNTFTVGNVELILDEEDTDGSKTDATPDTTPVRDKQNAYHLIPGMKFKKDPMVTVKAGSEESYVRMKMIVHNASAVQSIINNHLGDGADISDLLVGWNDTIWEYEQYTADQAANTITFEFRYHETVDGYMSEGETKETAQNVSLEPLFDGLIVPGETTNQELEDLYTGGFQMDIVAHAIQRAGFNDADQAWSAFDTQVNQ